MIQGCMVGRIDLAYLEFLTTICKLRQKRPPDENASIVPLRYLFLDAFSHLYKRVCPSVRHTLAKTNISAVFVPQLNMISHTKCY